MHAEDWLAVLHCLWPMGSSWHVRLFGHRQDTQRHLVGRVFLLSWNWTNYFMYMNLSLCSTHALYTFMNLYHKYIVVFYIYCFQRITFAVFVPPYMIHSSTRRSLEDLPRARGIWVGTQPGSMKWAVYRGWNPTQLYRDYIIGIYNKVM